MHGMSPAVDTSALLPGLTSPCIMAVDPSSASLSPYDPPLFIRSAPCRCPTCTCWCCGWSRPCAELRLCTSPAAGTATSYEKAWRPVQGVAAPGRQRPRDERPPWWWSGTRWTRSRCKAEMIRDVPHALQEMKEARTSSATRPPQRPARASSARTFSHLVGCAAAVTQSEWMRTSDARPSPISCLEDAVVDPPPADGLCQTPWRSRWRRETAKLRTAVRSVAARAWSGIISDILDRISRRAQADDRRRGRRSEGRSSSCSSHPLLPLSHPLPSPLRRRRVGRCTRRLTLRVAVGVKSVLVRGL